MTVFLHLTAEDGGAFYANAELLQGFDEVPSTIGGPPRTRLLFRDGGHYIVTEPVSTIAQMLERVQ